MNLEGRISRLEDRIGVTDEIPPLIMINVADQSRDSQDIGTPTIIVVPGLVAGLKGATLFREENEASSTFLKRCEAKHAEFYV